MRFLFSKKAQGAQAFKKILSKRAQGAVEYLLTHVWILALVAVAMGVLIVTVQPVTQSISCTHPQGFLIETHSFDSENIRLSVRNSQLVQLSSVNVSATDDQNNSSLGFPLINWDASQTRYISLPVSLGSGYFSAKIKFEYLKEGLSFAPEGVCTGYIAKTGIASYFTLSNPSQYTFNPAQINFDQNAYLKAGGLQTVIQNTDAPTQDNGSLTAFPGIWGDPGQSFTTSSNPISVAYAQLLLSRRTTNPSSVFVEIRSNSMLGPIVGRSLLSMQSSQFPTTPAWTYFNFVPEISLNSNTQYFLRLRANGTSGYVSWSYKHAWPTPYAGGIAYRFTTSSTTQPLDQYDFGFKILIAQGYSTTNPTIISNTALNITFPIQRFSETASKPAGTEIKYNLSNNNGTTWLWFNGTSWVNANGTYTQSNTVTEINSVISSFPLGSNQIKFKAFMHSDGINTPSLVQVVFST
ncbi:MAG: choice-of-anchor R domain-containing protein [Candidatus Diapherotrites archaeon]|nr:choice-of-anchor R domain-containing protein [Candidatus Diapherotrites archaeon]